MKHVSLLSKLHALCANLYREGGLLPCALYLLTTVCEYVICMSLNLIISLLVMQTSHLEALLEPIGARVRSYYVSQSGGAIPKDTFIAVCTIEKENSRLNRLL